MREKLIVLVVDDHQMVRDGMCAMLKSRDLKYEFKVHLAETGEEAIKKARNAQFDIVLLDYCLPDMNGPEITRAILASKPGQKILGFSSYNELIYIDNMRRSGANGYILKSIGKEELVNAIEAILAGKSYYSNEVAIKLIDFRGGDGSGAGINDPAHKKLEKLSIREVEIIQLVASEYTNEQIAEKLEISKRTVDTHRQNILKKLDVKNTAGLVRYALELKDKII